jgi:hypothetical protein
MKIIALFLMLCTLAECIVQENISSEIVPESKKNDIVITTTNGERINFNTDPTLSRFSKKISIDGSSLNKYSDSLRYAHQTSSRKMQIKRNESDEASSEGSSEESGEKQCREGTDNYDLAKEIKASLEALSEGQTANSVSISSSLLDNIICILEVYIDNESYSGEESGSGDESGSESLSEAQQNGKQGNYSHHRHLRGGHGHSHHNGYQPNRNGKGKNSKPHFEKHDVHRRDRHHHHHHKRSLMGMNNNQISDQSRRIIYGQRRTFQP